MTRRQIYITGNDWDTCYLNGPGVDERRNQVMTDLIKEVDERGDCLQKGDTLDIDVLDHSTAVELFEVKNITGKSVHLVYAGGGS